MIPASRRTGWRKCPLPRQIEPRRAPFCSPGDGSELPACVTTSTGIVARRQTMSDADQPTIPQCCRKNSESWRVDPTCQISKEICSSSARASNEWQLFRGPTPARPGSPTQAKTSRKERGCSCAAAGCRTGKTLFDRHVRQPKAVSGEARGPLQWKNSRPILRDQIAITTGRWRASYENWLVNSVSPTRVERYLILSRDTNKEVIAYTSGAGSGRDHRG